MNQNTNSRLISVLLSFIFFPICMTNYSAEAKSEDFKIGIIGLDTSHVLHFTKAINGEGEEPGIEEFRVVAAYPKGSPDIESSVRRVPDYTKQMQAMGIEIVDSIEELLTQVDGVLLETNDGRPHLEQVRLVVAASKPVFVDKPIAGSLSDAIAIFDIAREASVPLFSSSSLRFAKDSQAVRNGSIGKVSYCETTSPCSLEKTHPDLFWYGIHGCESLFTVMGTGCESVKRYTRDDMIVVEGTWDGGRTGIYRESKSYGGLAKGAKGEAIVGSYDGYLPLLESIVEFFATGTPPVSEAETLEIYAFMEAADESKRRGGKVVKIADIVEKANNEAKTLRKN